MMNTNDKAVLLDQYRKHPLPAYLGMACMGSLVAAIILFQVLQGRVEVQTRYFVVTLLHFGGALAGIASIRLAPAETKARQKTTNLWLTLVLNSAFFLLFGYRLLRLLTK